MSCGFGLRTGDFMIRVLHVVGRMDYGGAENRLLELARVTDPSGIYFDFCVLQDGPGAYANEIVKLGFGIVKCKLTKNVPGFIRRFRHLLRQGNYDAIHCHVYQFSGLPLRLAAKEKVPIRIMHLRTTRDAYRSGLYRLLYRKVMTGWVKRYATKIVAVSESAMTSYMGSQWKDDPRMVIIYNGLDVKPFLEVYDRSEVLSEFDISPSAQVIIHVGNFQPAKDHKTLINSAALIVARKENVHFLLVGDGPLMTEIRELAAAKGLQRYVHFAGRRNDVPRLLTASDCFIFPSKWEGLPGVVLEALAAGLPVIASDIGPNREVAEVSERVRLVPLGDEEGFAKGVIEVLSDPVAHKEPAGLVPERFRLDKFIQNIHVLYET